MDILNNIFTEKGICKLIWDYKISLETHIKHKRLINQIKNEVSVRYIKHWITKETFITFNDTQISYRGWNDFVWVNMCKYNYRTHFFISSRKIL